MRLLFSLGAPVGDAAEAEIANVDKAITIDLTQRPYAGQAANDGVGSGLVGEWFVARHDCPARIEIGRTEKAPAALDRNGDVAVEFATWRVGMQARQGDNDAEPFIAHQARKPQSYAFGVGSWHAGAAQCCIGPVKLGVDGAREHRVHDAAPAARGCGHCRCVGRCLRRRFAASREWREGDRQGGRKDANSRKRVNELQCFGLAAVDYGADST